MQRAKDLKDSAKIKNIQDLLDMMEKKKSEGKNPNKEEWRSILEKLGPEFLETCLPKE
jgi:hypothetical protein